MGPQSEEQTKNTLYSEKASFAPPKNKIEPQPPSKKVNRLNSQKIILNSFENISFAPSIYVTKNPAPAFLSALPGDIEKIYNKIVCKSEGWPFF